MFNKNQISHFLFAFFLTAFVNFHSEAQKGSQQKTLKPQHVAKSGDIVIPDGMYLTVDRTGSRWLLPIGMNEVPEQQVETRYFRTQEKPQQIGQFGTHLLLDKPISSLETVISEKQTDANNLMTRLPKAFSDLMYLEKAANLHANQSADLKALGVFEPARFTTFKLPYIPMPADEFEFAEVSNYAKADTKNLVEMNIRGKKYYRLFILPNHVDAYAELIAKHGIVYHYDAMTSSSPRSLVVMDPDHPEQVHWIKPSLHRKIDGSVRINTDKKARRAILMSEAINSVPQDQMRKYSLRFMLEPAAFQPKGKLSATIHREVAPELLENKKNIRWIPAFILQNSGKDAVPGLNMQDMIKASGESPAHFVQEKIVRPLLAGYLSMGLLEGLPGELHTQNFYYELKKTTKGWLPTGEIMFKDNDGFRYDTELALRRARPMKFFARFDNPFIWGKFSNTLGLGSEGIPFLGSWYYKLIRNVNGFETLAAYTMRALQQIEGDATWNKDTVQRMFDDIAAQEAERLTGIKTLRSEYGYGFMQGLNRVLNIFRAQKSGEADTQMRSDENMQAILKKEWDRLKEAGRVSALRRAVPKDAYYILHTTPDQQNVIECRTPRTSVTNPDPTVGFAILETDSQPEGLAFKNIVKAQSKQKTNIKTCSKLFN
jgi:hypothetical protein